MLGGEISYERAAAEGRKKKRKIIPKAIRQLAENLLLFAVFFALSRLCITHSLFSQIDWLMIYVILISVAYNIYQSALAAVLAGAAYLYGQNLNVLELNTFYSCL